MLAFSCKAPNKSRVAVCKWGKAECLLNVDHIEKALRLSGGEASANRDLGVKVFANRRCESDRTGFDVLRLEGRKHKHQLSRVAEALVA